ncbi:MAG: HD-GYP domain-containing protein [Desulfarculaceae bacterium]|nr:HD-GYP domain-containing protein [Desulfarculaceae bacterium]
MAASTVEHRDPDTSGHQQGVADLARGISEKMGNPEGICEGVYWAGVIHDIGKIAIPAEILSKPTRLTEQEFNLIKAHPRTGFDILKQTDFPWPVAEVAYQHHERLDGTGYPRGLKGEEILREAKIIAVADTVEAMTNHRPYRPALGVEAALEVIKKDKGRLYDPATAEACQTLFD